MSNTTQRRNNRALVKGAGEVNIFLAAASWAARNNVGSVDLGNCQVVGFKPETEVSEHEGSYRGEKLVDRIDAVKGKLSYAVKFDELGRANANLMLGGADATNITQSALTAQVIDTLGLTAYPATVNRWYDLLYNSAIVREVSRLNVATSAAVSCTADASTDLITKSSHGLSNGQALIFGGTAVPGGLTANTTYYVVSASTNTFSVAATVGGSAIDLTSAGTSVTYRTCLIESTDFILDPRIGRVRFLTAQSADVYPVVNASAIVDGNDANLKGVTPFNSLVQEGYGRVAIFDPKYPTRIAYLHEAFKCQVYANTGGDFDGRKIAEYDLTINVDASEVGNLYLGEK